MLLFCFWPDVQLTKRSPPLPGAKNLPHGYGAVDGGLFHRHLCISQIEA